VAERGVFVQSGEETAQGRSHCYLHLLDQKRWSQSLLRRAEWEHEMVQREILMRCENISIIRAVRQWNRGPGRF